MTGAALPSPLTAYRFKSFEPPYINSSGKLSFVAWGEQPGIAGEKQGVFTWDSSSSFKMLAYTRPAGGIPFDFDTFSSLAAINDAGTVAFTAGAWNDPPTSQYSGVFFGNDSTNIQAVALSGQQPLDENYAPIPNLTFDLLSYHSPAAPSSRLAQINNAGDIVFEAETFDTVLGPRSGWWYKNHNTAKCRNLIRTGLSLPSHGSFGDPDYFAGGTTTAFSHVDLSDNGNLGFVATNDSFASAYYRGNPSNSLASRFVYASGNTFNSFPLNSVLGYFAAGPFVRNSDFTGAQWSLNGFGAGQMLRNQPLAPVNTSMCGNVGSEIAGFSYPALNRKGVAVFAVSTPEPEPPLPPNSNTAIVYYPDSANSVGLPGYYISCGDTPTPPYVIAMENGAVTCDDPTADRISWDDFFHGSTTEDTFSKRQHINNNHQIVFMASAHGGQSYHVLYAMDLRFNRRYVVLKTGQRVPDPTLPRGSGIITYFEIGRPNTEEIRDNPDSGMGVINDCGKLAVHVMYTGGQGIFTWQMPAPADVNKDYHVNDADFIYFTQQFALGNKCVCDFNGDGCLDNLDIIAFEAARALGNYCGGPQD